MRFIPLIAGSLTLVGLAACSPNRPVVGSGPQGVTTSAPNAASSAPQSANSLPENTTVNGPVTTGVGQVGTTSGPARR